MRLKLKPIYRSSTNRIVAGIAGGLAKGTKVPAWVFRVSFLVSTLSGVFTPFALGIYALLWFVMPLEDQGVRRTRQEEKIIRDFWKSRRKSQRVIDAEEVEEK